MLRRILLAVFAGVIVMFAFFGCGDDDPVSSGTVQVPAFPNKVGSYWIYEAVDSVRQTTDTITVSIVGRQVLPGIADTASVWVMEPYDRWLGTQFGTIYVVAPQAVLDSGEVDTVKLYAWPEGMAPWLKGFYVLPFDTGSYWTEHGINSFRDSTHVMGAADAQTPLRLFKQASHLVREYSCGDECGGSGLGQIG